MRQKNYLEASTRRGMLIFSNTFIILLKCKAVRMKLNVHHHLQYAREQVLSYLWKCFSLPEMLTSLK